MSGSIEEYKAYLLNMFDSIYDGQQDTIQEAAYFMVDKAKEGYLKEVVEIWKYKLLEATGIQVVWILNIAGRCFERNSEDESSLLRELIDIIHVNFEDCIKRSNSQYNNNVIMDLIRHWKEQQFIAEDFRSALEQRYHKFIKDNPVDETAYKGLDVNVKRFAIFQRNYKLCKAKLENLNVEIKGLFDAKDFDEKYTQEKIDKATKTMLSLKVNRKNLLTVIHELIRLYRQNIPMRLHKINDLAKLKEQIDKCLAEI